MSFFFYACIAIHSKRTFSFEENFFKTIHDESDCDLNLEEDDLNKKLLPNIGDFVVVGGVVEWLKRRARDQHSLGSKPTRAILLCLGKDTL